MTFEADGYRALRDDILDMLEKAHGASALHRGAWADRLADADDVMLALTALRSLLRDMAAARAGATPERMLNADVGDRLVALGQGPLAARAVALADLTEETRTALRGNASRPMSMDVLVDALAG